MLEKTLANNSLFRQSAYVAGQWIDVDPENAIKVTDPASQKQIGLVPKITAEQTQGALEAAQEAQKPWAAKLARERADILMRWHDLIMENQEDLAIILTSEQGKPLAESRGEIAYGASFIRWFAEECRRSDGAIVPTHNTSQRIVILKQPIGVVAAITPWNFPNAMITRKVAPALAAGCAIVLKPAAQTPFSAIALAVLAEEAGIPKGLFSIVTGSASQIGGVMTSSSIVRKLTFTGSTQIGALLYGQCAPTIKKLGLELGGNAPFIVFDDADLEAAVEGALIAKYRNNGQTCVCANRIYVQSGVYEQFASMLSEKLKLLKTGGGFEEGVTFGPLIDDAAVGKVEEHIADALSKGAEVTMGGNRHALGGTYFEPTILTGVTKSMKVAREETFGPIAPLFKFEDEEDVVEQSNDTEFGLASYFYSRDLARVWRVSEALEYGIVGVNTGIISAAEAPFGGVKQSGLGREGSSFGLEDFQELKYVCMGGL
ncbi:NAD-dependent succinate-semialdehyde dehydrogenase [Flexibacterium corallicola]|uniref:NAD-dependent succinate-semialdehyde dehydrogenase n=1 Tax=Flexibacterium corallicola TaxID=3037259 RepID=UPI00286EE811|nr:NAD-dependent succinate-semialdehyde dehydrogenase [Pseudovibrio sp. M1P-2-3]